MAGVSLHEDIAGSSENYEYFCADLTDSGATIRLPDDFKPDVIINTAAVSVIAKCESDPDYAKKLNVDLVATLTDWCNRSNARLVHISTDTVFSGKEKIFHKETDAVSPPNVYGRTKADTENIIISKCRSYAIARVVLVYGKPLEGQHGNIAKLVIDKLKSGETVNIVDDQWRTPSYVEDVASAIEQLIDIQRNSI